MMPGYSLNVEDTLETKQQIARSLTSAADWVLRKPAWFLVAALIVLSLIKSGFVLWNWYELSPRLLENWGNPDNAFQSNVLLNAIATLSSEAGLDPAGVTWLFLQVIATVGVFILVSMLVLKRTPEVRNYLPLAILLSTGMAAVLWREIGRYDALFIAGISLAVLARPAWLIWVGVAIAAATSPEQLLVGSALLILLALLPSFRGYLATGVKLFAGAVTALVIVQIWFSVTGEPWQTRIGVALAHFKGDPIAGISAYDTKQGFTQFTLEKAMVSLSSGSLLVWSYLGAVTFLVILVLIVERGLVKRVWLVLVVTVFPITISIVAGEDRTRDLVLIMLPVLFALIMAGSALVAQLVKNLPGGQDRWLAWLAVGAAVLPLVYFYLDAEEPFHFLKEVVIAWNNGAPIELDGSFR